MADSRTNSSPDASTPTGASAKSILARLGGVGEQGGDYPHDAEDFGRCEALLDSNPLFRPQMYHMADVNAYWAALVPRWKEIRAAAPADQTALIQSVVKPIEARDPRCLQVGPGLTVRRGFYRITFRDEQPAEVLNAVDEIARKGRAPMKNDPDFKKHNQDAYHVTAAELRQFIERIEQLDTEKRDIAEQRKETMAEAKGRGYDTGVLRKVIALRKRKPDEIAEEEAVLEMYKAALGMA